MFNFFSLRHFLLAFVWFFSAGLMAQQSLHQLIVVSGGAYSNPDDFVELGSFNPQTGLTMPFGQIRTQAVQDALVDGNRLYVTATDSLVCYDLDTYQRIAAIALPGVRYLHVSGDLLFVGMQYPLTENFVRVLDKENLATLNVVSQVSGETATMLDFDGKVYVAVPGDWTSTVGKMAILNATDGSFIEEIDFQESGAGIHDLFAFNNKIVAVNRSAWGSSTGVISFFDPINKSVTHHTLPYNLGKGIAIHNDQLYLLVNDAVGIFDLMSLTITNPTLLPDPGSASFINYADIVFDHLGENFYATITDYFSMGAGFIYSKDGAQTGTFDAGISAEALALEYRTTSFMNEKQAMSLTVYPNPAKGNIMLSLPDNSQFAEISLFSSFGQLLRKEDGRTAGRSLNVEGLKPGVYHVMALSTKGKSYSASFLKQ